MDTIVCGLSSELSKELVLFQVYAKKKSYDTALCYLRASKHSVTLTEVTVELIKHCLSHRQPGLRDSALELDH